MSVRKVINIDLDAFYASMEQRHSGHSRWTPLPNAVFLTRISRGTSCLTGGAWNLQATRTCSSAVDPSPQREPCNSGRLMKGHCGTIGGRSFSNNWTPARRAGNHF